MKTKKINGEVRQLKLNITNYRVLQLMHIKTYALSIWDKKSEDLDFTPHHSGLDFYFGSLLKMNVSLIKILKPGLQKVINFCPRLLT